MSDRYRVLVLEGTSADIAAHLQLILNGEVPPSTLNPDFEWEMETTINTPMRDALLLVMRRRARRRFIRDEPAKEMPNG